MTISQERICAFYGMYFEHESKFHTATRLEEGITELDTLKVLKDAMHVLGLDTDTDIMTDIQKAYCSDFYKQYNV